MIISFLSWFNLPSLTDTYTSPGVGTTTGVLNLAGEYSSGFFSSLVFVIIGVAVGIPIAILALKWLIKLIRGNVKKPFIGNLGNGKINTYGINSRYQKKYYINRKYRGSF